ncbi:hypothetical protein J6590_037812 [Homalodisca vitripennis]|nr:hypothetical protein J6590_037812 [Homalodisca vitripennis]
MQGSLGDFAAQRQTVTSPLSEAARTLSGGDFVGGAEQWRSRSCSWRSKELNGMLAASSHFSVLFSLSRAAQGIGYLRRPLSPRPVLRLLAGGSASDSGRDTH